MVPLLAHLMLDPYASTRQIAYRSLRQDPQLAALPYDFVAPENERRQAVLPVARYWNRVELAQKRRKHPRLLISSQGIADRDAYRRLLQQRDNRPMYLSE